VGIPNSHIIKIIKSSGMIGRGNVSIHGRDDMCMHDFGGGKNLKTEATVKTDVEYRIY
jgi:hypothetical protein